MATDDTDDFRIRVGRSRSRGAPDDRRARSFVAQVNVAVRKAGGDPNRIGGKAGNGSGRFNARGRGAKVAGGLPKDGGEWSRDASGARFRSRRVVVKARVVKLNLQRGASGPRMRGMAAKGVDAHLRYLERDGVTKDGEKGRVYSAGEDEADGRAFIARGRDDRHQFRFIIAPEDSVAMTDLRGFTRDLMRQLESDLGTRLDWVAVDHYNTGRPHTHVVVRGITDDGKILNIAGDYIAHGVRHRASELVTLELGPQTELDVARKLANEVDAERLTRLDRMLIAEQGEQGLIDLRPNVSDSYPIRANRHLLIDRARRLERYASPTRSSQGGGR
jgi:type IV secretory pathway VirD2 relaxase